MPVRFGALILFVCLLMACQVEQSAPTKNALGRDASAVVENSKELSQSAAVSNQGSDVKQLRVEDHFDGAERELAVAAARGEVDAIKAIISSGRASANTLGKQGMPVLLWPVYTANLAGFKALLEQGGNPNLRLKNALHAGESIFGMIVSLRGKDYVSAALAHGADVNAINQDNEPVVHIAQRTGKSDVVRLLIEKGANVDATSNGLPMNTLLAFAVGTSDFELSHWLIEHGANAGYTISAELATSPNRIGAQPILEDIFHRKVDGTKTPDAKAWQIKCQQLVLARGLKEPPMPERYKAKG